MGNQVIGAGQSGMEGQEVITWLQLTGSEQLLLATNPSRRYATLFNYSSTAVAFFGGDTSLVGAPGSEGGFPIQPLNDRTIEMKGAIYVRGTAGEWVCAIEAV